VGATRAEVDDRLLRLADLHRRFAPDDEVEDTLRAFQVSPAVGTVEQVAEALHASEDAGMTYAICYSPEAAYDKSNSASFPR
jgi:hypothetical protein